MKNSYRRMRLLLLLALPVLLPGAAELGLRGLGYGEPLPLFRPSTHAPEYKVINDKVVHRFLGRNNENHYGLRSNAVYFYDQKPADGLRIMVQGGSTANGFPYGYGASLTGMLERRLKSEFPGRTVEVIDTSMPAISTTVLLDFADEIIAEQPDAVLIYAGHDEYLGLMGVDSQLGIGAGLPHGFAPAVRRLFLRAGELRTVQFAGDVAALFDKQDDGDLQRDPNLTAAMARGARVDYGSAIHRDGIRQYEHNLSRLLEKYRAAGIKVFIGTLVSNVRDQTPFDATVADGADEETWHRLNAKALEAYQRGDETGALELLDRALEIDADNAAVYFKRARVFEATGRYEQAYDAYVAAKDRDRLPFRAPSEFNDVLRDVAARYGATLVDVEQTFREHSPDGLIGHGLITEHCHPNTKGYLLMSEAFLDALEESGIIGEHGDDETDRPGFRDIPLTPAEYHKGDIIVKRITSDYPFTKGEEHTTLEPARPSFAGKLGMGLFRGTVTWDRAMELQAAYYWERNDTANYIKAVVALADAIPFLPYNQFLAGKAFLAQGDVVASVRYLRRAVRYEPENKQYWLTLSQANMKAGRVADAKKALHRALSLHPGDRQIRQRLDRLQATGI